VESWLYLRLGLASVIPDAEKKK